MTKHVRRTIGIVKFIERFVINTGWFKTIHDGSQPTGNVPGDTESPQFYTRRYRMELDGEPVNTFVKFVYNYRDNWADFYVSTNFVPDGITSREASCRRMLRTMVGTSEEEEKREMEEVA